MGRFRRSIRTKRRKAAVVIALAALIPATALAYFVATLSPTDSYTNTNVGAYAPTALTITYGTPTGGPLLPGVGTETEIVTLTNNYSSGPAVILTSLSVVLAKDGSGGIYDDTSLAYIPGCQASWFTLNDSVAGGLPTAPIQPGGHVTATITTSLQNVNVDQSACENTTPQINLVTG